MTRAEAIAGITARLAELDDDNLITVAEFLESMSLPQPALRDLSPRERTLLERSKEDFKAGRTYSHDEMVEIVDNRLEKLGVPRSRP